MLFWVYMNNLESALNLWILKNDVFSRKFKILNIRKEGNRYIISTEKTTKKNIDLLKRALPSFFRYTGQDVLQVIFDNQTINFGDNFVENLVDQYIKSLGMKDDELKHTLSNLGNNIFKLDVTINPKNISQINKFKHIKVSNDKFLKKDIFPKEIRNQIIVNIDYSDKFKSLLQDINQRWKPKNEFDIRRNVKFVINSLYSDGIIVLMTEPLEMERENPNHPWPANSYYFQNMRKLQSTINRYLKLWGIIDVNTNIYDLEGVTKTNDPYIIEY